ncbi:MAG TPA: hypothetical protein VGK67_35400 [Myxococcales bacterium]|jgi:hypothetical protein
MRTSLLALLAGAALLALSGCPDSADMFTSGRLLDPCNSSWPVCTTTAGCFVGNSYYLEGQFPGTRRFIVRTDGQASVTIALYLKSQGAAGEQLRIEWNDASCGNKTVEEVDGKAFFKEVEAEGSLRRTKNVYRGGDHLIEVSCDSNAEYLLKAEVNSAGAGQ